MNKHKQFKIIFLSLIIAASAECGSTSAKWTKDDFSRYAQTKEGSKKFAFKCFATEINLKTVQLPAAISSEAGNLTLADVIPESYKTNPMRYLFFYKVHSLYNRRLRVQL